MTSGPEHCSRPQGRAELFGSEAVHCSVNGATSQHSGAAVKLVLPLDGARLVADWGHSQSEHRVALLVGTGVEHRLRAEGPVVAFFWDPSLRGRFVGVRCLDRQQERWVRDAWRTEGAACLGDVAKRASLGPVPSPRTRRVASRLRKHLGRPGAEPGSPLAAMAARCGISANRLSRTFAQEMGVGFARYLQHLRVATALGKMSTGEGIAAAARDADFADQAHFGRTMRNTLGRSPGDVRRRDTIVQER